MLFVLQMGSLSGDTSFFVDTSKCGHLFSFVGSVLHVNKNALHRRNCTLASRPCCSEGNPTARRAHRIYRWRDAMRGQESSAKCGQLRWICCGRRSLERKFNFCQFVSSGSGQSDSCEAAAQPRREHGQQEGSPVCVRVCVCVCWRVRVRVKMWRWFGTGRRRGSTVQPTSVSVCV